MKVPVWHLEEVEFVDAKDVDNMLGEDAAEAWAEFLSTKAPGWVIDTIFNPGRNKQAKRLRRLLWELTGGGMISFGQKGAANGNHVSDNAARCRMDVWR